MYYRSCFVLFTADDDQEGVLDGLMEALNTGSAFRDPTRPARKKAGGKKGKITCVTNIVTKCHIVTQLFTRVFCID